ncbi:MAG: SRPBCC family protein [Candidatus Bathyarchaeia archaeon]|jgi:uncharacterized protein YndB with AHSA1/START domain
MTKPESESMRGTIVKVFQVNASPDRVYRAFTVKEDLQQWMADYLEVDPRKGGKFKMGREEDGMATTGEFLEVVPNQLLVYTWSMNDYDKNTGKRIPKWSDDNPSKVTVKFEKAGNGTKITLTHEGFPERDEEYWGHEVGWEMLAGEVLKYFLEHSQQEFDKWWKENEASWQERWQKTMDERVKSSSSAR